MKDKMLQFGTIVALLVPGSLYAGSDYGVSNRFALGEAERIIRSTGSHYRRSTFHVTVRREYRRFVFTTGQSESVVIAGIYSIAGRKIGEPVPMRPDTWYWSLDGHREKRYGSGYYLAVFECEGKRSTVPIIVERGY